MHAPVVTSLIQFSVFPLWLWKLTPQNDRVWTAVDTVSLKILVSMSLFLEW